MVNKMSSFKRSVIVPMMMLSLAVSTGGSSVEPAPAAQTRAPRRVNFEEYKTAYEISSQGCSRAPALVCTITIQRVGDGRDNGLVVYAQSSGGTSTVAVSGKRYPATGVRLANSRQPFPHDKYWKTYADGEESMIELEFADAGPATVSQFAVAITALAGSQRVIRFEHPGGN